MFIYLDKTSINMPKQLTLLFLLLFITSLPLKSNDLYTYSQKAYESYKSGNYGQAIYYYKKINKLMPNDDKIYSNLALAYKKNKRFDLALKAIDKAIELNPDLKNYHLIRADLYSYLNNNEKAINIYKELYKKFPDDKQIKNNLAYYFDLHIKKYKNSDLNKAIQYATDAVYTLPDSVDFLSKLGLCHIKNKNYDTALNIYKKILKIDPSNKPALNNYEYIINSRKKSELRYAVDRVRPTVMAPKKLYKLVKIKKGVNPQIRQRVNFLLDLIYSDYEGRILLETVKKKKIKIIINRNGKNDLKAYALKKSHTFSIYGIPVTFSSDTINIEENYINGFF